MVVGLTVSFNCMYCFIWSLVAVIRKHDVKWFIFVSSMSRSSSWCFRIRLHKSFDVFVSILSQCDGCMVSQALSNGRPNKIQLRHTNVLAG